MYRQGHGGCYYISVDQIFASARLRRMQLYSRLHGSVPEHTQSDCCLKTMSESEAAQFDGLQLKVCQLSEIEKASLYFICGYVCYKEKLPRETCASSSNGMASRSSEFTRLLSRGRLCQPPEWLLVFACFCYAYFGSSTNSCANRLVCVFQQVFESFIDVQVDADRIIGISKRLANSFLKGLVRRGSESARHRTDACSRRLQKLKPR